jgi:Domain of unknown function (DUF4260)
MAATWATITWAQDRVAQIGIDAMSAVFLSAGSNGAAMTATSPMTAHGVSGVPKTILRLEGAVVLFAALAAYGYAGSGWILFALLFLVPDLSMLGYLRGPRFGALTYNFGHSYALPALIGGFGFFLSAPLAIAIALIWIAHIGFDRLLGYGLKYGTAFGHTHMGVVGKSKNRP